MYTLSEAYAEDCFCYYKNILLNNKQQQGEMKCALSSITIVKYLKMLISCADFCIFLSKILAHLCRLPLPFPENSDNIVVYSKYKFLQSDGNHRTS